MMRPAALFAVVVCFAWFVPVAVGQEDGIGGRKWSEWVEVLKSHKDIKERRRAILALEVAGVKRQGVLDGLLEGLAKDTEPELRRQIALVLGTMGPDAKGAPEALGEALKKDKADVVREAAARSLAGGLNVKADGQVLVLAGALKDPHQGTRVAAADALKNLGDKAKPALDQIGEAAKNPKTDRITRLYTLQIIGKWGDALSAPPVLLSVAKETDAPAGLREAALEGLGRVAPGHMNTAEVLTAALEDKGRVELRRAAATALGLIGAKAIAVWPTVKTHLEYGDKGPKEDDAQVRHSLYRVAANVAKGDKIEALDLLLKGAKEDPATENRLTAILELGELGAAAKTILKKLETLADEEPRPQLREAAQNSVAKIKAATN